MLTMFTIPKPFAGHIGVIQRNAIQSWLRLQPRCQIILCGDDAGVKEVAAESRCEWIPAIARNEYGTPLLDSAFKKVIAAARHDRICYVNADIMLMDDFLAAIERITFPRYLMIGRRWDVALNEPWDFDGANADGRLRRYVEQHGKLHPPSGSDYFVFPRRSWIEEFPAFAVGRPGWDTWLIYAMRRRSIPVIDASNAVMAVHQNHDYGHVPAGTGRAWGGPEAEIHFKMVGGWDRVFTLLDATHVITATKVERVLSREHLVRYWATLPILRPATRPFVSLLNLLGRGLRGLVRAMRPV